MIQSTLVYATMIMTSLLLLNCPMFPESNYFGALRASATGEFLKSASHKEYNSSELLSGEHDETARLNPITCNFNGQQIRVAVSPQPPFVDCTQDLFGDWMCNGSNIEVIRVLEQKMNFKSSWVVLANNHYDEHVESTKSKYYPPLMHRDRQNPVGELARMPDEHKLTSSASTGLLGLVGSGRVLLSANGVMKTLDRQYDFNLTVSAPFDSFRLHFLLSKSVRDHDHIFIKPFTVNAWLAILASAVFVVPIFYALNTTSRHYSLMDDKHLLELSLRQCSQLALKHLRESLKGASKCTVRHSSSLSSTSSLEHQINKAMRQPPFDMGATHFSQNLPSILQMLPMRGESERRKRLVRRQWAFERRTARRLGLRRRQRERSGFSNLAYIVWYVVASLAYQGGETEDLPQASSTRVLIAFWWLYLIVICAIHSGILTAILTFPKQNDFIQTLDDYLNLEQKERANLRLSVDKYSELAHLLANVDNLHKSPLQQLVLTSKVRRKDGHSEKDSVPTEISYVNFQRHRQRILDEVQQGRAAFMEEKSTITQIITQEYFDSKQTRCLYKASRYPIDVVPMSLILSKKLSAECVRVINLTLRRIFKSGLAQKWRRKYESPGNDCLNSVIINAGDVDKIELKHVIMAFWLLLFGSLLGLVALLAEIAWLFLIEDEDVDEDEDGNDDDDESDDTFLSSSSSSNGSFDSDHVQLGFRRPLVALGGAIAPGETRTNLRHIRSADLQKQHHMLNQIRVVRSLQARRLQLETITRRTKRQHKFLAAKHPKIVFTFESKQKSLDNDAADGVCQSGELRVDESEVLPGLSEELRTRRSEERRRRREAKVAEKRNRRVQKTVDLFKRLHSGQIYTNAIRARMRRMSAALVGHFEQTPNVPTEASSSWTIGGCQVKGSTTMRRRLPGSRVTSSE